MDRIKIKEAIVVEGRDDVAAVERAAEALMIPTHGYGIRKETLELIEKAYKSQGIIIFTDPDRAGENIRRRLLGLFPRAKQAFLPKDQAEKAGDIGIENASPEDIQAALLAARSEVLEAGEAGQEAISMADMDLLGLAGGEGAAERRAALGKALGIGNGNAKALLKKINGFGITREEVLRALKKQDE